MATAAPAREYHGVVWRTTDRSPTTTQPASSSAHATGKLIRPSSANRITPPTPAAVCQRRDAGASSTRANTNRARSAVSSPRSFHLPTRLTERSAKVARGIAEAPNTTEMSWKATAATSAHRMVVVSIRTVRRVRKRVKESRYATAASVTNTSVSVSTLKPAMDVARSIEKKDEARKTNGKRAT